MAGHFILVLAKALHNLNPASRSLGHRCLGRQIGELSSIRFGRGASAIEITTLKCGDVQTSV
jgi:hypothetical protein